MTMTKSIDLTKLFNEYKCKGVTLVKLSYTICRVKGIFNRNEFLKGNLNVYRWFEETDIWRQKGHRKKFEEHAGDVFDEFYSYEDKDNCMNYMLHNYIKSVYPDKKINEDIILYPCPKPGFPFVWLELLDKIDDNSYTAYNYSIETTHKPVLF